MFFELARQFLEAAHKVEGNKMSSRPSLPRASAGCRRIATSRCPVGTARARFGRPGRSARTGPDNSLRQRTVLWLGATSNDRDTDADTDTDTDTGGARVQSDADAAGSANAAQQPAADVASTPADTVGPGIDTARLSTEEIQRQMGELRRAKEDQEATLAAKEESLASGVLEEVGLIQWPSFGSAFVNTLLVVAIVLATSFTLFGVNTALTELSGVIYAK